MKTYAKQKLACCDEGARYVRLDHSYEFFLAGEDLESAAQFVEAARKTPPDWVMYVKTERDESLTPPAYGDAERVVVHERCPFCSADLPELRLKTRPPKNIMTVTDGGYYCGTCEERLGNCQCAPPDRLWEAVKS